MLFPETLRGDLDRLTGVRLLAELRRKSAKCGRRGSQMSRQVRERTLSRPQMVQEIPQLGGFQVVRNEVYARDLLRKTRQQCHDVTLGQGRLFHFDRSGLVIRLLVGAEGGAARRGLTRRREQRCFHPLAD